MIILNIITFPNSHITPLPILSSSNFSSCDYFYYRSRAKRSRELLIRDVLSSTHPVRFLVLSVSAQTHIPSRFEEGDHFRRGCHC